MSTPNGTVKTRTGQALACGEKRKLIVAQDADVGFFAILNFEDLQRRIGAIGRTPDEALTELERVLERDAAREMVEGGAV